MKRFIINSIMLFACLSAAMAQNNDTLYNENVIVNAAFKPTIISGTKLNKPAVIVDTATVHNSFDYSIQSIRENVPFEPQPIKAAKFSGEPLVRLYQNYLRVGFGNYVTPLADLFVNNTRSDKYAIGLAASHRSSWWRIKDLGDAQFSNTEAALYGKKFFSKYTLATSVDYANKMNQYYAAKHYFKEVWNQDISSPKRSVNTLGFNASLNPNNAESNDFNISASAGYRYAWDTYAMGEHNLNFSVKPTYDVDWIGFANYQHIGGEINMDYLGAKEHTLHFHSGIFGVEPHYLIRTTNMQFTLGFNVNIFQTSIENTDATVYPNVDFQYAIVPDVIKFYIGATGNMRQNTFLSTVTTNPFLAIDYLTRCNQLNTTYLHPSDNKLNAYVGFKNKITSKIAFNIFGSYNKVNDDMLFVNFDQTDLTGNLYKQPEYRAIYDNIETYNAGGELVCDFSQKLTATLRGEYFYYKTKEQAEAWNRPEWSFGLQAAYHIADKFVVSGNIYSQIGRKTCVFDYNANAPKTETLDPFVDANLSIEYRYTKLLSAFAMLNNIAAQRNYSWADYPSQRFNFLLGITYSFGAETIKTTKKGK